ncbi:LacI family transcriptional regulator [Spirochaetia bacterium]|nr:LacI family transcriptional regulator [Spirochaetia bacterium]
MNMKKIAELAGVSRSTVSHVLHGRTHKMTRETLERVRRVIEENNYVPNMGGRMFAKYGSKIIGVVINYDIRDEVDVLQDPFFSKIISTLEHEIRTNGYFMMLYISKDVEESLRMARTWNVEALISVGGWTEAHISAGVAGVYDLHRLMEGTVDAKIPLVYIDAYFPDEDFPYINVGLEDWQGGYIMTEYLINRGHRKIAFLGDTEGPVTVGYAREQGCKAALEARSLSFLPEDYINLSRYPDERQKILKNLAKEGFRGHTALFFTSDYLAANAINLFRDEGIGVPRDISVCGFDDFIFATESRPRLTTVRQDVSQKAFHAVQQALALIRKEEISEKNIRLPVSLVIRDSVAAL